MEMKILYKWNSNFCSERLEQKECSASTGCPFVCENFHLILPFDHTIFISTSYGWCLLIKKYFYVVYDYTGKTDLSKGYWNPKRKLGVTTLFFFRDN